MQQAETGRGDAPGSRGSTGESTGAARASGATSAGAGEHPLIGMRDNTGREVMHGKVHPLRSASRTLEALLERSRRFSNTRGASHACVCARARVSINDAVCARTRKIAVNKYACTRSGVYGFVFMCLRARVDVCVCVCV